jgi:hypothetical protein
MSEASWIHIQKLIIHKVDHMNYDAPLLSDLESPVTDPDVLSFLRQHIFSNMTHKHTRTARFMPAEKGQESLRDVCDVLLENPDQFVPQSQKIATSLFATMDKRVSPGDLVLCTFAHRSEDEPTWLAMLKMDPEDGFVGERVTVRGKSQVVLRRVANVLPRGELQKCAFILPPEMRTMRDFDLRVLDQQIDRQRTWRLVASYFSTRFLECEVEYDPQDRTRAFFFRSHEWLQTREHWPKADLNRAHREVKGSLRGDRVDATVVAQEAIHERAEQDEYLKFLQNRGVRELVFTPDPKERDRLLRYTTFEGDNGLRVRIETDAVGRGQTLWWEREPDTGMTVVTIRTKQWDERPI